MLPLVRVSGAVARWRLIQMQVPQGDRALGLEACCCSGAATPCRALGLGGTLPGNAPRVPAEPSGARGRAGPADSLLLLAEQGDRARTGQAQAAAVPSPAGDRLEKVVALLTVSVVAATDKALPFESSVTGWVKVRGRAGE